MTITAYLLSFEKSFDIALMPIAQSKLIFNEFFVIFNTSAARPT